MAYVKYCYVYNVGDEINGQKPFQQLITMDVPEGVISSAIQTYKGLTLKYGSQLYYLPLPGEDGEDTYITADKLCYRWKSKKFVFPGRITLGAAKITKDCGGAVTFRLYVDCRCVYQTDICDCQPFRLPSQISGMEVEIEVIGQSRITKIEVASSIQELVENE